MKRIKLILLLPVFLMGACVPSKKFNDLQAKYNEAIDVNKKCNTQLEDIKTRFESVKNDLDRLNERLTALRADSLETHGLYNKYKVMHNDLNDSYEKLLNNSTIDKDRLASELKQLEQKLKEKENDLNAKEADLKEREKSYALLQANLNKTQGDLDEKDKKVQELTRVLQSKDSAVNALKNSLTKALLSYKDKGMDVSVKNGKVYVSMDEKLLFASGSIVVDSKGKQALLDFANAIKNEKEVSIMIEGHTDDVPIKTAQIKDNWDLSVLRATSIVRLLTGEGSLEPTRIIPSGRGEYFPVDDAKTAAARAKNRRIEIILTPKLDELFKILGN